MSKHYITVKGSLDTPLVDILNDPKYSNFSVVAIVGSGEFTQTAYLVEDIAELQTLNVNPAHPSYYAKKKQKNAAKSLS